MNENPLPLRQQTRRHFFQQAGFGIGAMALASLMKDGVTAQSVERQARHHAPKAKNLIFLFMAGGPSQSDLFDPKPLLNKYDDKPIPDELVKGERFAFIKGTPLCLGSPFKFKPHGQSGAVMSELLPALSKHADELAIIRSMHTTILHLMGIDHTKLTYRFQGRDFRLTDVFGRVVQKALA